MTTHQNPLLDFSDLPLFDAVTPQHIATALDPLLEQANEALEQVTATDFPADWKKIAAVLDVATEKLSRAWGAISHLHSVADTPELRAAYTEALPRVTEFYTRLGCRRTLVCQIQSHTCGIVERRTKTCPHLGHAQLCVVRR